MDVFGQTRSRLANDYALITPDTHVISPLIGWENTSAIIHISPEIGARFTQFTACMESGAVSSMPGENIQRFLYVQSGKCIVDLPADSQNHELTAGGYAFFPAGVEHVLSCNEATRLIVFEKDYQPHQQFGMPSTVIRHEQDVEGEPIHGG